jgi:hypothetical protein
MQLVCFHASHVIAVAGSKMFTLRHSPFHGAAPDVLFGTDRSVDDRYARHSRSLHGNSSRVSSRGAAFLLAAPLLGAQDLFRYRNAELGASLQNVAAAVGIDQKAATIEHQRPILMRDLDGRYVPPPGRFRPAAGCHGHRSVVSFGEPR